MGLRFRKPVNAGPLRANLSGRGIGWSIGVPGLRIGITAQGGVYLTIGFPGSGFCYTTFLTKGKGGERL